MENRRWRRRARLRFFGRADSRSAARAFDSGFGGARCARDSASLRSSRRFFGRARMRGFARFAGFFVRAARGFALGARAQIAAFRGVGFRTAGGRASRAGRENIESDFVGKDKKIDGKRRRRRGVVARAALAGKLARANFSRRGCRRTICCRLFSRKARSRRVMRRVCRRRSARAGSRTCAVFWAFRFLCTAGGGRCLRNFRKTRTRWRKRTAKVFGRRRGAGVDDSQGQRDGGGDRDFARIQFVAGASARQGGRGAWRKSNGRRKRRRRLVF